MVAQTRRFFLGFLFLLVPLALSIVAAESGVAQGIEGKAFHCVASSTDASGDSPFGAAGNSWQAHVSGGISPDLYPYFLIRERKEEGRVEVVFFNDQGLGYFVELPYEGQALVLRRKGRGESGAWQRKQIVTLEYDASGGLLHARIGGSETYRRLLLLKRTFSWQLNYSFKPADPGAEALQKALRIDKRLVEAD